MSRRSRPHRARTLVAAVAGLTLAHASPALADPAVPTDYRSTITAITPDTPTIEVAVVGGDSFLEVRADAGHEVTVLGYSGEPYLRILADGATELNRRSPAVGINTSRFGGSPSPVADATAIPEWQALPAADRAGPSTLIWHDHRTHWMGGDVAPETGPDGLVQDWHVGLVVDGVAVDVAGALHRHDSPSGWWWSVGVLAFALLLAPGVTGLAAAAVVASAALLTMTTADLASLPGPARPAYTPLALLALAVVAGVVAVGARRRWWSAPIAAGAGAACALAAWMLRAATTHRFVPGPSPDRVVGLAVVLVGAIGVLALARGVLASALGTGSTSPGETVRDDAGR